jgi:hypothetical protein
MVDAPEATWVLYFLRSLFRVTSSMFQALWSGIAAVLVWWADEDNGACSELLSLVIPERPPLAAARNSYNNLSPDVTTRILHSLLHLQAGEPDGTQSGLSELE